MLNSIQIVAEYSLWFILLCLLLGAVYAFILYFKSSLEISRRFKLALAFVRFLCVSIIAFLLLSPYLKSLSNKVEKPIIIFAQDNSASVTINKDSAFYKKQYPKEINTLLDKLSQKFEVRKFSFGDKVSDGIPFNFIEKQTDINQLMESVNSRFVNRNVGALILATDGIYNKGINPLYSNVNFNFPVYTLALGDTVPPRDAKISQVQHNKIVFLDNQFPLKTMIDAHGCANENIELTIFHKGKKLFSKALHIKNGDFHANISTLLKATDVGMQKYTVKITRLKNEVSYANNNYEVFIDVLNSKQKILILANAPQPDIAAIRTAIETSRNYAVEAYLYNDFKKEIKPYSLIILYELPSLQHPLAGELLNKITKSNIPLWIIIGNQTHISDFNGFKTGLNLETDFGNKSNDVQGSFNTDFPLFVVPSTATTVYDEFPPIAAPFGNYQLSAGANVLFYQRIGSVETKKPLWFFNTMGDKKVSVFCGNGLWRWRLYDYKMENNTEAFDNLIKKTVQYLAVKADQSRFKINIQKRFYENEPIKIEAQFYNKSYEPINEPAINVDIYNKDNKKYSFAFNKSGKGYFLNVGNLPVGEYTFKAYLKYNGKDFEKKGNFSVVPLQVEANNTVANYNLLYNLSKKYGGKMYLHNQTKQLLEDLLHRKDITSIAFQQKKLSEMINLKWLFFLILLLLAGEWTLRKMYGGY